MGNLNLILLTLSRVVGLVTNSAPLWKNNGKAPQVFCLRNSWSAFPLVGDFVTISLPNKHFQGFPVIQCNLGLSKYLHQLAQF
jgi:hypothetical protein